MSQHGHTTIKKRNISSFENPYDNAVMESFFVTFKREEVYQKNTKIMRRFKSVY